MKAALGIEHLVLWVAQEGHGECESFFALSAFVARLDFLILLHTRCL